MIEDWLLTYLYTKYGFCQTCLLKCPVSCPVLLSMAGTVVVIVTRHFDLMGSVWVVIDLPYTAILWLVRALLI